MRVVLKKHHEEEEPGQGEEVSLQRGQQWTFEKPDTAPRLLHAGVWLSTPHVW